jgi:hypothetical protein
VDRHDRGICAGNEIPEAGPDVLALPLLVRAESKVGQDVVERSHPGAIVPDHHMVLRQDGEEIPCLAKLRLVRAIKPDDDAVEITRARKLPQNVLERRTVQLGIERGQDQRNLARLGEGLEVVFQLVDRPAAQVVELGDVAVLVKIRHARCPIFRRFL